MENTNEKKSGVNYNSLEKQVLEKWHREKIFEKTLKSDDRKDFVFYDGPPFATGLPHYGSILSSLIKDCIPRYQTMRGNRVRRRWGWDCHGLPIENLVEKQLQLSGKKQILEFGVDKFNAECRGNILRFDQEWKGMIERVARWVDMDRSYKTMDTTFMESVWWGLKQVWDKGLIYEDKKVLLYCGRCETPISNFEVAMDNSYKDVTEESVYPKFRIKAGQMIGDFAVDAEVFALAWTTTPWTLPANTALHISDKVNYTIVLNRGEKYILAENKLSILEGEYTVLKIVSAKELEGLAYFSPFDDVIQTKNGNEHKIYIDSFVDSESATGTGIVHGAVMYGEEDYNAGKMHNLPLQAILDPKGHYLDVVPETLRGKFFKSANPFVLADLFNRGLVYKTEKYTHSYPHCYRCATPLYYNALSAWFIKISAIKDKLIENNEDINWYPSHLKHGRFKQGIENAPDWNISRNRFWATPLPFFKCEQESCKKVICIGSVKELQEKSINFANIYPNFQYPPLDSNSNDEVYTDMNNLDLHKPYIDQVLLRCECGSIARRVPEVVDCWVESGSMPFAELHYPFENKKTFDKRFPSDFVVEYIPQTRAWFYCMHVMATAIFGKAPFRNVLTTGTVLGEDGAKMSKSKGNYPDPSLLIEKHGADALRMYMMTSPVVNGEDIAFAEKQVEEVVKKVNNIFYNVVGFYNLYAKGLYEKPGSDPVDVMDKWLVSSLADVSSNVIDAMDRYELARAGKTLEAWINELSTWYVRRSRDRFKQEGDKGIMYLGFAIVETAKLLAPFMPFIAEYAYLQVTQRGSVHMESLNKLPAGDSGIIKEMASARGIVETALALRKNSGIKIRQPLARLLYIGDEVSYGIASVILAELNIKKLERVSSMAGNGEILADDNGTVAIDLYIDKGLMLEGYARDIERSVQDMRKKMTLKVGQEAGLYYNTTEVLLEDALHQYFDKRKTNIRDIQKSYEVETDYEQQVEIDGKMIWLGIVI